MVSGMMVLFYLHIWPQNLAALMSPSLTNPTWKGKVYELERKARETHKLTLMGERLKGTLPGLQYHKDLQLNKLGFGGDVPVTSKWKN